MYRPKKQFGQHFLNNVEILHKIVEFAELKDNDIVWEIGPGFGNLTDLLLTNNIYLTIFEIDNDLIPVLQEKYNRYSPRKEQPSHRNQSDSFSKCEIIHGDFIKLIDKYIRGKSSQDLREIKIVTNLPYQISSPFLFKITENHEIFSSVVVMLQDEVARRVCGAAGTKEYGVLSLKIQYYFDVTYLFKVNRDNFSPPPKVESAVIKLIPRADKPAIENIDFFWKIIEKCFSQKRKTLRNNLRNMIENIIDTRDCPIDLNRRGETLNEEEFISLYSYICKFINS